MSLPLKYNIIYSNKAKLRCEIINKIWFPDSSGDFFWKVYFLSNLFFLLHPSPVHSPVSFPSHARRLAFRRMWSTPLTPDNMRLVFHVSKAVGRRASLCKAAAPLQQDKLHALAFSDPLHWNVLPISHTPPLPGLHLPQSIPSLCLKDFYSTYKTEFVTYSEKPSQIPSEPCYSLWPVFTSLWVQTSAIHSNG